ncbi:YetF domain-containing protein [Robertmurraya andreesenii]|uniref:Uncharacterized membrane protein YcaP (DUF421 family) n=1 Tax=Anoxybacillus andreesenii TaxID=1325932 RepID=A0ABT9V1Q8_9BACL|nr:DUF421 domain-containing protein [Robertmurraya andreesenii]MDQ0154883.1 uncharacterized membrane protein YcaP (DUF421 family) [Robertmurraya andreesenii]
MQTSELIIRIVIGFIGLLILTRIMGRKEISKMTSFHFVSAIAIGSIAANFVLGPSISIKHGLISLIGWTIFTLLIDIIDFKSMLIKKITSGEPVIVIKEGKIIEKALRKNRLDVDTLKALLRDKNIFNFSDVDYAIFETNGKLSVLPKEQKQPITKSDLELSNMPKNMFPLTTEVVSDGKIISENLTKLNLDVNWLHQQLLQAGVKSVEDVFYAEVQEDGSLFIDSKDK